MLVIGFVYGLGHVYRVPDPGFSFDGRWHITAFSSNCELVTVDTCNTGRGTLHLDDRIVKIYGPAPNFTFDLDGYNTDLTATPFDNFRSGDEVRLDIVRNEQPITVFWVMPDRSNTSQIKRLSTIWVFLPFWLAGSAVLLFVRPKDVRWRLLILQNYITGLWLAIGTVSYSQIFGSTYLSIGLSWLIMPVYLHLHLLLPSSLHVKRRWWIPALYAIAGILALLNMLGILPLSTYYLALFIGIGGSLSLLLLRTLRPGLPAERSVLNLMLLGIGVALLPGVLLYLLPSILLRDYTAPTTVILLITLAIPSLSFFYTYAIYKHRLGNQEVRANRALSSYSFVIIYASVFVFVFVIVGQHIHIDQSIYSVVILIATIYMLAAFAVRPPFERFMNRLVYGTTYEPEHIVQQFANEIPRALNPAYLSSLLSNQVMPSLLIRQSALYWMVEEKAQCVHVEQAPDILSVLTEAQVARFQAHFASFIAEDSLSQEEALPAAYAWVRLVIPIELDGRLVGLWLFGRRDPDDFYPQRDIELLMTLGSQVGIALESTRLFGIEQHRADELARINFELHRAIRVKNDMLRNISHELRTPLTAISGYTELLIDGIAGELTDDQNELLSIVADRTQDLRSMINDLIAYQQERAQEMDMGTVNIVEIAQAALQTTRTLATNPNYAGHHPHSFVLDCVDTKLFVQANPTQINQVFTNLLSNAVKFSPQGGTITVTLRAGVHQFEHKNQNVAPSLFVGAPNPKETVELPAVFVSIQDEGIGIPAEELENIWMDFYQVDGSATRRFGGTGLGLALVRDIIHAHNGAIWADSQVGVETIITFAIPGATPD
ncbi:MAG: ATP-binding protein [Caldilineaceae bacterium]